VKSGLVETVLQKLLLVWSDFDTQLNQVPLIDKLNRGKLRLADYQTLLLNLRQQVVDGSGWISRAASSLEPKYAEIRSILLKHAVAEHRDFELLERDFVSVGGTLEEIRGARMNIGSEAFSAYMYQQASRPNPLPLLGAMFIIEGLGQHKAAQWGKAIREQLNLAPDQVRFLMYHGENDESHMQEFHDLLGMGDWLNDDTAERLVTVARVTARLYRLQLEELQ
jgi:3-oxoacyl-[acyl-carrier-protein] synthase-3